MENQNTNDQNGSISDIETDEENEEGDYTVYECPGLAPVNSYFLFHSLPAHFEYFHGALMTFLCGKIDRLVTWK